MLFFASKGIPHEYAVVITVEMDQTDLATAPSFASAIEVAKGYGNLAGLATNWRFHAGNGLRGYPGTALGGLTDYAHLAEVAGLGAIGYHGLLIYPRNKGARLRINTIYTNITNLPMQAENEHLWVRDFCAMCKKCIRSCPVQAIYDQPRPRRWRDAIH